MSNVIEETEQLNVEAAIRDSIDSLTNTVADGRQEIEAGQYVTFYVNDECFAFPMDSMREIIRVPETVAVPLTPGALRGLANLRGTVLPILDMRHLLNLPSVEANDATRVLITDYGQLSGLIVDRVARVIHVADDQIESADHVSSTVNSDAIDSVINGVKGYGLIQLLNLKVLIEHAFSGLINHHKAAYGADAIGDAAPAADSQDEVEDDTTQLVSFMVNGQEYAFEIMQVEEIVRVPENISAVPKSQPHVLGLMDLRGRLLPLVSLRAMFRMPVVDMNDATRVLVISLDQSDGVKRAVGIVVDDIREVLRITAEIRDRMPRLFVQGQESSDIEDVCRLDNGKRLVSILNVASLFDDAELQRAVSHADDQNLEGESMSDTGLDMANEDMDTQLVVFHLQSQEYGVSIESVQEIIRVPEEMSRVPKTASFIEGMINLRGAVLPVLDMRSRFDMGRNERNERQRILVLELEHVRTGFIVDEVNEVLRISKQVIEDSPELSADQSRLMGKVVNLTDQERMIQILEASELLDIKEMSALKQAA